MNETPGSKFLTLTGWFFKKLRRPAVPLTENHYHRLFETSREAFFTLAPPTWRFTDCNPAAVRLFGFKSREEFLSVSPWNLSPQNQPDGRNSQEKALAIIQAAINGGSHFFEWTHQRYSGELFPAAIQLTRIDHRSAPFLLATVRDISDQKEKAERLHTMAELLDIAPNSITIHDLEGQLLYVNRKTLDLHGYDNEQEFMALNLHQIDVPESKALITERMQLIEEQGEASFEVRHFRKDGTVFPLLVYVKKTRWHGRPALMSIATDITERNQAEAALRESEERWQFALEGAGDGLWDWDPTTNAVFFSRQWKAMLGFKDHEISNKLEEWDKRLHPDDRERCYADLNRHLSGETTTYTNEHRLLCKDGSYKWILDRGKVMSRTPKGQPQRVIGIHTDITERKHIDEALRENEQKYRTLIEGLPDIVMRFDRRGRHLFVSENISRVLDIPADRFTGKTHRELGFSELQCRFWEDALQKVFSNGTAHETEFTFESKKGAMVFNWRLQPELNLRGEVASVLSIARDITKYRQAEQNYHMLFQEMLSGFAQHEIIVNDEGQPVDYRYLTVNPAFEKMTGLKADDLIGKTVLEVMPDTEPYWIKTFGQVALTGTPTTIENYSAEIQKHFHVSAFRPAPRQFACIVRDITAQKKLEAQIRQTEKMESIGRLAGGIAHDFNNMLSVILGHAQNLLEEAGSDMKTRLALEAIEQAAQRSAELTSQLLGFARKQIVSPRILDLNGSVEKMIRMLRRIVGENIALSWRPGPDLWPVKIDPSQLDQILVNLVSNARSAVSGKGKIIITTVNASLDASYMDGRPGLISGEYVLLAVSDNGCGMDREMQRQIFDPFFTTREVGQGTGMGLATVYGIVKQNKGFIYVDSEPGTGTVFTVYLPRQTQPDGFLEEPIAVDPVPNFWKTVLLVEDAPQVLEMCRLMLEKLGYTVLPAATPAEALRLAKEYESEIDLLICDVIMPEMNGAELAGQLTRLLPDIKCLFMSGYTADIIAGQGVLEEGMNFIEKPFTKKALEAKIRDIFKHE